LWVKSLFETKVQRNNKEFLLVFLGVVHKTPHSGGLSIADKWGRASEVTSKLFAAKK